MHINSNYFYGHEVSEYGKENGYVDYRTLAQAFDAVLNNNIMESTADIGYWEEETPSYYFEDTHGEIYTEEEAEEMKEKLNEELEALEDIEEPTTAQAEKIDEINADLEALENYYYRDIFQYFIVSDNGADILKEAGEIVFYNEALDMYVWGVTHYGTAWDYVLSNIKIEK